MPHKKTKTVTPATAKPRKRWMQFGIRGLLLLTLLAAIAAWWWSQPEKQVEELADGEFRIVRYVFFDNAGKPYRHGPWRLEEHDGYVLMEGEYRNDKRTGSWTHWHSSGGMASQGEYVAGSRQGIWRTWREDGTLESETTFAEGVAEGPAKLFDAEGRLESSGAYLAGQRAGEWSHYHTNGKIAEQGPYFHGLRSGVFKNWDQNGAPLPESYFAAGLLIPDARRAAEQWSSQLVASAGMEQVHACQVLIQLGQAAHPQLQALLQGDDARLKSLVLRTGPPSQSHNLQKDFIELLEDNDPNLRGIAMNCLTRWRIPQQSIELPLERVLELEGNAVLQAADPQTVDAARRRYLRVLHVIADQETLPNGQARKLRSWAGKLQQEPRIASLAALVSHLPPDDQLTEQLVKASAAMQSIEFEWSTSSMQGGGYVNPLYLEHGADVGWPPPLRSKAIPALIQYARVYDPEARRDTIRTLAWLQTPTSDEAAPLVEFLATCLTTGDEEMSIATVRALQRLGKLAKPAVPKLRTLRWTTLEFELETEQAIEVISNGMPPVGFGNRPGLGTF